jgi:hypothetical protein
VILSHIFVLGYGWFFVDALMLMVLAVIYVLLTRTQSHWGEPKNVETTAALQTHKKRQIRNVLDRVLRGLRLRQRPSCKLARGGGVPLFARVPAWPRLPARPLTADQRFLTCRAKPGAVFLNPCIGETSVTNVALAFFHA